MTSSFLSFYFHLPSDLFLMSTIFDLPSLATWTITQRSDDCNALSDFGLDVHVRSISKRKHRLHQGTWNQISLDQNGRSQGIKANDEKKI
ncbi:hypothetical protein LINGRAHAP2_LOCUS23138 [Linum grandiflorum]